MYFSLSLSQLSSLSKLYVSKILPCRTRLSNSLSLNFSPALIITRSQRPSLNFSPSLSQLFSLSFIFSSPVPVEILSLSKLFSLSQLLSLSKLFSLSQLLSLSELTLPPPTPFENLLPLILQTSLYNYTSLSVNFSL